MIASFVANCDSYCRHSYSRIFQDSREDVSAKDVQYVEKFPFRPSSEIDTLVKRRVNMPEITYCRER